MLCLFLRAGTERLAVPASSVVEVVPAVRLHPAPGGPPWLAGLFRFRGSVTPVLDLHRLIEGSPCPVRLSTRIVVIEAQVNNGPRHLGLLAERVTDLKALTTIGAGYKFGQAPTGPDLGPIVADAEGVVRIPDINKLVPLAYQGLTFGLSDSPSQ